MKNIGLAVILSILFLSATYAALIDPAPGVVYLSPLKQGLGSNYLLSLDNNGDTVYSQTVTSICHDFKRQNNQLTYICRDDNIAYVANLDGTIIDTYQPIGYGIDHHDFILNDNEAWLLGLDKRQTLIPDVGVITVTGFVIQALSVPTKSLIFEWNSFDHIPIDDTVIDLQADQPRGRYIHINSIDIDPIDDNIIFSARHLNQIIKIDRQTGDVMWRMGGLGANNDFTLVNDYRWFTHQHDARRLPNGNLTLFDNGNQNTPQFSRGIEYELDEINMIITKTWEYSAGGQYYAPFTGNVQRLDNGHTLIGWGGAAIASSIAAEEVTPDNILVKQWTLPDGEFSYRALKYPWVYRFYLPLIQH